DTAERIDELQCLSDEQFNIAATQRSAGVLGDLKLVTKRSAWPIITQLANQFYAERTAFVAEAAHVLPPIGAQGLNLSLGDIEDLLDRCVADPVNIGGNDMLAAYHTARHPVAKTRVMGVGILNRASMADHPMARQARAMGIQALHSIAPLRKTLMRLGLGLR
ncbi:MAG: FAD-dependent monooxygenase, partial [Planktomarina sp.]